MTAPRLPTMALVGRPNVGKSSLFNALAGRRAAIVDDTRGVTRDRLYAEAAVGGLRFHIIDTGGFEPHTQDPLLSAMRDQAQLAVDEADVVVLVTDCRDGVLPADSEIAALLRRSARPCVLAVNKVDGSSQEPLVHEFTELGFDETLGVSAIHRRGLDELAEAVARRVPPALRAAASDDEITATGPLEGQDLVSLAEQAQDEPDDAAPVTLLPEEITVAVVGRPNVGKSSLINRLLGEDRLLVADIPGTTRDAVDTVLEYNGRRYRLIDTAGLRRKRSIAHRVERYSVVASLSAVSRADVTLLVVDTSAPIADQDRRVAGQCERAGKALILVANKQDLLDEGARARTEVMADLREGFGFVGYAPICPTSAITGRRVFDLLRVVDDVVQEHFRRVPTSAVNKVLEQLERDHPAPVAGRARAKLLFGAQVAVAPPTFIVVCRRPDAILTAYRRFVERRLREAFGFDGTPMVVAFRSREGQRLRAQRKRGPRRRKRR